MLGRLGFVDDFAAGQAGTYSRDELQTKRSDRWLDVKEDRRHAALSFWFGDLDVARRATIGAVQDYPREQLALTRRHRASIFTSPLATSRAQR